MAFDAIKNFFGANKPKPETKPTVPESEPIAIKDSTYAKGLNWTPLNLPKEEPYIADTSPIKGWEPLNPLAEVLELIPATMPECFKDQAKDAIRYIQELDQGTPSPEALKFASKLAQSSFVIENTLGFSTGLGRANPNMLPTWLKSIVIDNQPQNSSPEEANKIQQIYEDVFDGKKIPTLHGEDQIYFAGNSRTYEPPHATKCYLEEEDLYRAFSSGFAQRLLTELSMGSESSINRLKVNDKTRLVVYFTNPADYHQFTQQYSGMKFRGPVQDPAEIRVDPNDTSRLFWRTKNISCDSILWNENPFSVDRAKKATYESKDFAKRFVALCAFAGKNPVDCLTNSFIYFCSDLSPRQLTPAEITTVEQETSLPIYVTNIRTQLYNPNS